MIEIFY